MGRAETVMIVAGADGTPNSEPALLRAAGQAGREGRLVIVHA
ncbi:hypothetical protein [Nonomuraea turkmeniaca]|nr:hypothetical protein [Nonomuraea turkmeniaca]